MTAKTCHFLWVVSPHREDFRNDAIESSHFSTGRMCIFIDMVSCVGFVILFVILRQRAIAKGCGAVVAKCKGAAAATLLLILLPLLLNCTAAHAQSLARALSLKQNDTASEIPVTLPNETNQH